MKANRKIGRFKPPGTSRSQDPIQDAIHLEDYVSFINLNGSPGAALLSNGKNFQFKFAFRIRGIHPTLSDEQMTTLCSFLESGIKSIPDGETITVIQSVFPDNSERVAHYRELAKNAPNPLFKEMVKSAASPGEYFTNIKCQDLSVTRQLHSRIDLAINAIGNWHQSVNSVRACCPDDFSFKAASAKCLSR